MFIYNNVMLYAFKRKTRIRHEQRIGDICNMYLTNANLYHHSNKIKQRRKKKKC